MVVFSHLFVSYLALSVCLIPFVHHVCLFWSLSLLGHSIYGHGSITIVSSLSIVTYTIYIVDISHGILCVCVFGFSIFGLPFIQSIYRLIWLHLALSANYEKNTHRHIPYMLSDPLCVRIIRNCRWSHHAHTQFGTNCSTAQTRCVIGNFNSFSESDMIMHFQFICCCWCWCCVVCRMFARVHLFVRSLRFTHSHLDSCRPPYSHINLNYLSSCRHTYSTLWFRQIELNSTKNALSFFPSIANRE